LTNRDRSLPRSKILRGRKIFNDFLSGHKFSELHRYICDTGFTRIHQKVVILVSLLKKNSAKLPQETESNDGFVKHTELTNICFPIYLMPKNSDLHGVFMIQHTKVNYHSIEDDMITLLESK
jgi:hypothetical protein